MQQDGHVGGEVTLGQTLLPQWIRKGVPGTINSWRDMSNTFPMSLSPTHATTAPELLGSHLQSLFEALVFHLWTVLLLEWPKKVEEKTSEQTVGCLRSNRWLKSFDKLALGPKAPTNLRAFPAKQV